MQFSFFVFAVGLLVARRSCAVFPGPLTAEDKLGIFNLMSNDERFLVLDGRESSDVDFVQSVICARPWTNVLLARYRILDEIATGSFGVVNRVLDECDRVELAMKCFFPTRDNPAGSYREERHIMQLVGQHDNILSFIRTFEMDGNSYALMPLMKSELYDIIASNPYPVEPSTLKAISRQVLGAISWLHSKGIVHNDVTLRNIMVQDSESLILRLGDFGLADQLPLGSSRGIAKGGTMRNMPFEKLFRIDTCSQPSGDIWAFGVVVAELISALTIWDTINDNLNSALQGNEFYKTMSLIFSMEFGEGLINEAFRERYELEQEVLVRDEFIIMDRSKPFPNRSIIVHSYCKSFAVDNRECDLLESFLKACLDRDYLERASASHLLTHPFLMLAPSLDE